MPKPASPLLLVIDGNAILHRAYHALPPLTAPDGRVVHAAYGFLTILFKALADFEPSHVAVTFDLPGGTFRNELFPEYQAQREEKPDELYAQIPMLKDILAGLGVPVYEAAGFEADDVIGTIVERAASCKLQAASKRRKQRRGGATSPPDAPRIIIVTGDKDLLQLVDDGVEVVLLRRGMTDIARYDRAAVEERFGFGPERIPDFKALAGDPSDNYPGVPGVGEKTAAALVQAFGGVEEILKNAERRTQNAEPPAPLTAKLAAKLRDHAETARLGLRLATIARTAPVEFRFSDCERRGYDRDAVVAALREFGFTSLVGRLPTPTRSPSSEEGEKEEKNFPTSHGEGGRGGVGPITEILTDAPIIRAALADVRAAKRVAFAVVADGDDPRRENPLALGVAFGDRAVGMHPWGIALSEGAPLLRDANIAKDVHGAKAFLHLLHRSQIDLQGLRYDTEILSYLLAPGSRSHDLAHVTFAELGIELKNGEPETNGAAAERAAAEAVIVQKIAPILSRKVEDAGLTRVYEEFERPLIPVLARMEAAGVRLDIAALERIGKTMRKELEAADRAIFKYAGEEFNVDSPKQLKRILFEVLGLAVHGIKKTAKGGTLSTAAAELEKLRSSHPIIEHLFTHRELSKLLSTYVSALPTLVDSADGRVHTTYHQTVTATGRLSSSDPNLQNIPASEPWGPAIRSAFVAEDGCTLLAFDYSQFELRIAATLSGDRVLQKAFHTKQDIHAATASEVFGVAPEDVTRDQRRVAKAINFGILYGMGAGSLAATAAVSRGEADAFIQRYFTAFPELSRWIEATKAQAAERGYVETLFGRKRFLPEITSGVPMVRAAAERMAVNMPVQGTQADLLKRAMIRADEWIRGNNFSPSGREGERDGVARSRAERIRMVLTVHDELVFEVREDAVEEAVRELRGILEGVERLAVPIVVEARVGQNWGEMEHV